MVFAVETEDVLQAWALPIENNIGVGVFDLAPAANPLTSGVGREGSLGCSASSVPPERLRLSPIEGVSKIKVIEEGDFWSCRRDERLGDESVDLPLPSAVEASLLGLSFLRRVSVPRVPFRAASAACSRLNVAQKE